MSYATRFINPENSSELVNLYHLARTALAFENPTLYERKLWAADAFSKKYPGVTAIGAYKDLCGLLDH